MCYSSSVGSKELLENKLFCQLDDVVINSHVGLILSVDASAIQSFGNKMLPLLFSAFSLSNPLYSFKLRQRNDSAAISSLLQHDASLILIQSEMTSVVTSFDLVTNAAPLTGNFSLYPFLIYSFAPTYNFPQQVLKFHATSVVDISIIERAGVNIPSLPIPLRLDLDAIVNIMIGVYQRWDHPMIVRLNPEIPSAFARANVTDPTITVVLCCTDTTQDMPLTNNFFNVLNQSATFQTAFPAFTFPFNLTRITARYDALQMKYSMSKSEEHLVGQAAAHSFSFSYALSETNTFDATRQVLFTTGLENGTRVDIASNNVNTISCLLGFPTETISTTSEGVPIMSTFLYNKYRFSDLGHAHLCSPFQIVQSMLLYREYKGRECSQGEYSLKLARYLLTSDNLLDSLHHRGVVRISEHPQLLKYLNIELTETLCDGYPMLITRPLYWSLSQVIATLGTIASVVGWAVCAFSTYLIFKFRKHPIILASSLPFQLCQVLGLILLFALPLLLSLPVSDDSCQSIFWLLNLGLIVRMVPLFLKLLRVFLIFGRQQLSLVRITNGQLSIAFFAVLAVEIVQLAVFHLYSPLRRVYQSSYETTSRGLVETKYAYCGLESPSTGAFVLLAWILMLKVLLLAFGGFLATKTRNVAR